MTPKGRTYDEAAIRAGLVPTGITRAVKSGASTRLTAFIFALAGSRVAIGDGLAAPPGLILLTPYTSMLFAMATNTTLTFGGEMKASGLR